jgi:hypothetical protein
VLTAETDKHLLDETLYCKSIQDHLPDNRGKAFFVPVRTALHNIAKSGNHLRTVLAAGGPVSNFDSATGIFFAVSIRVFFCNAGTCIQHGAFIYLAFG